MRDRLLKLRREQMRRPLPMRVFALFMAVVMVISVITVTNPKAIVNADPASGQTYTDSDYVLKTVLGKNSTDESPDTLTGTKTIYVPYDATQNNEVSFTLPDFAVSSASAVDLWFDWVDGTGFSDFSLWRFSHRPVPANLRP